MGLDRARPRGRLRHLPRLLLEEAEFSVETLKMSTRYCGSVEATTSAIGCGCCEIGALRVRLSYHAD
jgi:hypothetical protein